MMAIASLLAPRKRDEALQNVAAGLLSSAPPIGITGPWQTCRVGAEATGADRSWSSLMSRS